jgi:hypothetical protein
MGNEGEERKVEVDCRQCWIGMHLGEYRSRAFPAAPVFNREFERLIIRLISCLHMLVQLVARAAHVYAYGSVPRPRSIPQGSQRDGLVCPTPDYAEPRNHHGRPL